MILPAKSAFYELRKKRGIIPVTLKMNADEFTPIGLFYRLKGERTFLLESAESGKRWGRYSFLGRDPYMVIKSYKDEVHVETGDKTEVIRGKVLDEVRKRIAGYPVLSSAEMPAFISGAVGYVGYDVVRQYEKLPDDNPDVIGVPEACLMFYKEVIAYDHFHHTVSVIHNVMPEEEVEYDWVVERLNEIRDEIMKRGKVHPLNTSGNLSGLEANCDKESLDMCIAIRTIVFKDGNAYIQSGAGIVYDSVPEMEYQETLNKAMALKEVL